MPSYWAFPNISYGSELLIQNFEQVHGSVFPKNGVSLLNVFYVFCSIGYVLADYLE